MKQVKKILITGASGLLGNWIVKFASKDYIVTPTDIVESPLSNVIKADITDLAALQILFQSAKPNTVIHTASETNVDKCEIEKDRAWKINVEGTRNIVEACRQTDAKLIYISTDYVFDGEKGMYSEEDTPNPLNFYGLTKLEGERQASKSSPNMAILRTSVLYGTHPTKQDFVTWVMTKLKQANEITVVDDHFNTPTLAQNLASMALEIAQRDLKGIFHTSGSERISRFDFARKIAVAFGLDDSLIKPIKMKELAAWIAIRPRDSSLNTVKIQRELKTQPLSINVGLSKLRNELKA